MLRGSVAVDLPRLHHRSTQRSSPLPRRRRCAVAETVADGLHRHPDGNAFIVRTFGSLKVEAVWPEDFENLEQALAKISWWINDYNTECPHSSLNYRTHQGGESRVLREQPRYRQPELSTKPGVTTARAIHAASLHELRTRAEIGSDRQTTSRATPSLLTNYP